MTYQIDILNPKAKKLLQDLAELNLISIRENQEDGFMKVVAKLRKKSAGTSLTLADITKVVETVRTRRYADKKR